MKYYILPLTLMLFSCETKQSKTEKELSELYKQIKETETIIEAYKSVSGGESKDEKIRESNFRTGGALDSLEKIKDSLVQTAAVKILQRE